VWWYFFLLAENRTIPATATALGAVFIATAGMLAHTLHGARPVAAGTTAAGPLQGSPPSSSQGDAALASTPARPPRGDA